MLLRSVASSRHDAHRRSAPEYDTVEEGEEEGEGTRADQAPNAELIPKFRHLVWHFRRCTGAVPYHASPARGSQRGPSFCTGVEAKSWSGRV